MTLLEIIKMASQAITVVLFVLRNTSYNTDVCICAAIIVDSDPTRNPRYRISRKQAQLLILCYIY